MHQRYWILQINVSYYKDGWLLFIFFHMAEMEGHSYDASIHMNTTTLMKAMPSQFHLTLGRF